MKKRTFLLSGLGLAGALFVGWSVHAGAIALERNHSRCRRCAGQIALNGWVRVGAGRHGHRHSRQSEMGQGVHTSLAMLLAEELDCDWTKVRIEHSPVDHIYNNISRDGRWPAVSPRRQRPGQTFGAMDGRQTDARVRRDDDRRLRQRQGSLGPDARRRRDGACKPGQCGIKTDGS